MSIDRQRISAVEVLQRLGYSWTGTAWTAEEQDSRPLRLEEAADKMHAVLMDRAETLAGCVEGGADESELEAIGEALEAYETVRWPEGKVLPAQR